jgi:hypothetical protein
MSSGDFFPAFTGYDEGELQRAMSDDAHVRLHADDPGGILTGSNLTALADLSFATPLQHMYA